MAALKSSSSSPVDTKTDASQSKSSLLAPREFKRRFSKKGKDAQPNGSQQDATDDAAAPGGSVTSSSSSEVASPDSAGSNGSAKDKRVGADTWQDPSQAPAAQGDASSAEHTTTADKDTMREKASLSTAATGTATGSRHRKDKSEAHSATVVEKTSSRVSVKDRSGRRKKKSFWSKLTSALFKCTWSQDNSHPIDVDEGPSGVSDPSRYDPDQKDTVVAEREKESPIVKENAETPAAPQAPKVEPSVPAASTPIDDPPLTPAPDLELPESNDPAVVVPPPSTSHIASEETTGGVTSGSVVPPGATGHDRGEDSEESSFGEDEDQKMDEEDEEERLIMNGGAGIPIGPDGIPRPLLPPIAPHHAGRKCLVLDLDETLVHSSFKSIQHADYVVPVEIEYHWHNVYVIKRPGVDNFLKKMGEIYEVVVFTASLSKYADPVLDKLDIHGVVSHRLFRESCYNHKGNYVKDLSQLGRPIADTIILDNSPASYIFHPNNAVPVSSWFNDPHDTELTDLCPFLSDLGTVQDVRGVLDGGL